MLFFARECMRLGFGDLQSFLWCDALFTVKKAITIRSWVKRDGKAFQLNDANADKLQWLEACYKYS